MELPESEWGTVELIGQAEQLNAPVFLDTGINTLFTWTGSDGTLARHFMRDIDGNNHIIDVLAFFPQQQQVFQTPQGALMLWLDRTHEEQTMRLQTASLSFTGERLAGAVRISKQRTRNYSAIELDTNQFRIITAEGLGEVTNLHLYHVDNSSRPVGGDILWIDGDYPALIRDDEDNLHLFWLSNNGRSAYHARFNETGNPELVDIEQIARNNLTVTDAIQNFSVGFDGQYVYLLWTVRQIDDSQSIWMSSGQLSDVQFSRPAPLLTATGESIQWIAPAQDTQHPLPLIANSGEDLLLLWMQNGSIQQTEFMLRSGQLIGTPYIVATEERIGISWTQVGDNTYANLFYLSLSRD